MCGITGIYGPRKAERRQLEAMLLESLAAIRNRGPDDQGTFVDCDAGVGLGHARLAILDLSPSGHQPMLAADGKVMLIFNGEIYNYRELRADLERAGVTFEGTSDTEVLLQLLVRETDAEARSLSWLSRLNGIFAFAAWDARSGELLLVRDGLGVKPLYYAERGNCVAFASELKALPPLIGPVGALDPASIERYLTFQWCPGTGTPARDIKKLAPGEALRIRDGTITDRIKWYRLPCRGSRDRHDCLSTAAAIDGTRSAVRGAVHRQMVSDVPLGAFLSGGLDSSSVVAFAREVDPNIRCFTIETSGGSDAGFDNDLPYARKVAQHLGVTLDVVSVDARDLATELEEMVWHLDEPLADPAPLNVFHISRAARQCGMKVLLSGAGGDDLFTGYRRHLALLRERYWSWLPKPLRRKMQAVSLHLDARTSYGRRLRKVFAGAHLDGDERIVNYLRWLDNKRVRALFTAELRAKIADSRPDLPMLDFLSDIPTVTPPLERMLALEQRFFLADHNLTYTDKMSMAVGVEVRVPFLDLDLVKFAATIPSHLKQRGNCSKWVLKEAMSGILPQDVIHRPKVGFGAPLEQWVRQELREWIHDLLSESTLLRRGLFNPVAVNRLLEDNEAGRVHAPYTILSLACIEVWCRRFIDHRQQACSGAAAIH